jgi:drug/metabolite transporter (DMT)-like permease
MDARSKVAGLLALNGLILATHMILARRVHAEGVDPIVYALAGAAGAAFFLMVYRWFGSGPRGLRHDQIHYGVISGAISVALPQVLIYSASTYVSAGIASPAYAFPTPLTYLMAAAVGLECMSAGRTLGVGIGFAGAITLALSRAGSPSGEGFWVLLAVLAPLSIVAGNIYRARFWPRDSAPFYLALAVSGAGALWLAGAMLLTSPASFIGIRPEGCPMLAAGAVLAAFGNVLYFELQRAGGIVSFSQIGYVGAVLGVAGGSLVLGEHYAPATWMAAAFICIGILISEVMKRRTGRAAAAHESTP